MYPLPGMQRSAGRMMHLLACPNCGRTYTMLGRTLKILVGNGYGVFCQDGTLLTHEGSKRKGSACA